MEIRNWLKQIKPVIGMVHLLPLPGSPRWQGNMDQVLERAGQDARHYQDAGFHAVLAMIPILLHLPGLMKCCVSVGWHLVGFSGWLHCPPRRRRGNRRDTNLTAW